MAAAGVRATYHRCDVADAKALARVLDDIRRADGPIEGILHGARASIAPRVSRKRNARTCWPRSMQRSSGTYNLMRLTQNDPVAWFIGYGSISGRLGSNGQTDYALASDMLCEAHQLVSQASGPVASPIGFHWHPGRAMGWLPSRRSRRP